MAMRLYQPHSWAKGRFSGMVLYQLYGRSLIKIRIPGPTYRNSNYKSKARVKNPPPQPELQV